MTRRLGASPLLLGLALMMGFAALGAARLTESSLRPGLTVLALALCAFAAAALWRLGPAWTFSGALLASVFASNWDALGVPGPIAPERLLLALGGVQLLWSWRASGRDPVGVVLSRVRPVHTLMAVAVLFAVGSGLWAGTLNEVENAAKIVDRFGIVPFAMFFLAPLIWPTERERKVLLGALVGLGAYLGITALLETTGPEALVFPGYIVDESYGYQPGRARGPFAESVTMGVGLFVCAIAAAMAAATTDRRLFRAGCAAVVLLCLLGLVFTLTRSVWLGSALGAVIALLVSPWLRRYAVVAIAGGALVVAGAVAAIPDLRDSISERSSNKRTVWDRGNTGGAGLRMVEEHPLLGVGWSRSSSLNFEYQRLADDYPLTGRETSIHNLFLMYAAELGLVGLTLWLVVFVMAIGGSITRRGPPHAEPWRLGLIAIAVCWVVVASFVYPQVFPMLIIFTWAGVVAGAASEPATQSGASAA